VDQNSRLRCVPTRIHVITFSNNTRRRTSFVLGFKTIAQRATGQDAVREAGLRVCWESHGSQPSRRPRLSQFLGALAKLRKGTVSFLMSPFVSMEQIGSHWTDFHEIWYVSIFRISVEKSQFHQNLTK